MTEVDLQVLITNGVIESKQIEYKQELPENDYDSRKKALATLSSFANATGGYVIYGVEAIDGIPQALCGLPGISKDEAKLKLENLLADNIEPRIPGIVIHPVDLQSGNYALVVYIPRSWARPHVVSHQRHWRFYSRNSAGKYPLDVSELRTIFTLSETIAEKIRQFRMERLSNIVAGTTPISIDSTVVLVLHLVPIDAFDPASKYDLTALEHEGHLVEPIRSTKFDRRYNLDGLLTYSSLVDESAASYLQVFRNGCLEAVETSLLSEWQRGDVGRPHIKSVGLEDRMITDVSRLLSLQEKLGVHPPVFLMLSLTGVQNYIVLSPQNSYFSREPQPIDRNELILPEIMVENLECETEKVLKPCFDAIWNASGWPRSMNYDAEGRWKPKPG